ncbi:hypothetical protein WKI68_07135 [Streptomyces sp. MS1.HAVA.3]|uniref:Uncharacterized protein n=1 Tax=Streptomyces caledonius TaxID=3134107 RepID=A0ABU8U097_9ACTN
MDPREELASAAGQGLARAVSPPVAMARVVRMAREFMPRLTEGVVAAVRQGADVLLTSTLTDPVCAALGEASGLPSIGVYLQPIEPTGAFPPLVTGTRSFGPYGNRLAAQALWAATDRLFAPAVGELRHELGLPRQRFGVRSVCRAGAPSCTGSARRSSAAPPTGRRAMTSPATGGPRRRPAGSRSRGCWISSTRGRRRCSSASAASSPPMRNG